MAAGPGCDARVLDNGRDQSVDADEGASSRPLLGEVCEDTLDPPKRTWCGLRNQGEGSWSVSERAALGWASVGGSLAGDGDHGAPNGYDRGLLPRALSARIAALACAHHVVDLARISGLRRSRLRVVVRWVLRVVGARCGGGSRGSEGRRARAGGICPTLAVVSSRPTFRSFRLSCSGICLAPSIRAPQSLSGDLGEHSHTEGRGAEGESLAPWPQLAWKKGQYLVGALFAR